MKGGIRALREHEAEPGKQKCRGSDQAKRQAASCDVVGVGCYRKNAAITLSSERSFIIRNRLAGALSMRSPLASIFRVYGKW